MILNCLVILCEFVSTIRSVPVYSSASASAYASASSSSSASSGFDAVTLPNSPPNTFFIFLPPQGSNPSGLSNNPPLPAAQFSADPRTGALPAGSSVLQAATAPSSANNPGVSAPVSRPPPPPPASGPSTSSTPKSPSSPAPPSPAQKPSAPKPSTPKPSAQKPSASNATSPTTTTNPSTPTPTPRPKLTPPPPAPPASPRLYHMASGKCMDANGASVYFGSCQKENVFQGWIFTPDGLLKHEGSNKCLDADGDQIYFNDCQPSNQFQSWKLTPEGLLMHTQSSKCIDAGWKGDSFAFAACLPGAASMTFGTKPFPATADQKPSLLQHSASGKCMDSDGNEIYYGDCQAENPFQVWKFTKDGFLKHEQSGKCLTMTDDQNSLSITECGDSVSLFELTTAGNIHAVLTPRCLDGDGSSFYFLDCSAGNPFQTWQML